MMVNIQVTDGTATCNSSRERCGYAIGGSLCAGVKEDGVALNAYKYFTLGINERNFPQCGMIFPADKQVTPPAQSPTAPPTS